MRKKSRQHATPVNAALYAIWCATVSIFKVNNEIELGNAIWASLPGDKIILKSGEYGNIPLKQDVSYAFEDEATAADILGLGIGVGGGEWSAGSVEFGNIRIENPKIKKTNIKLYYIFQKKLPFNSRLENATNFLHANGVTIEVAGNDKESFFTGGHAANAESQLPKAIVNIFVPVLEEFDIKKIEDSSLFLAADDTNEERAKLFEAHQVENNKKNKIEKNHYNSSIGLQLNEFEYKALWSLNSFIREYSRISGEKKINGLNVSEFKDGLLSAIVKTLNENVQFTPSSFVQSFTSKKFEEEQVTKLSASFLSAKEYSISEFTDYQLNNLNYSFSTIGMYQEFESMWELYSPDKTDKWGFIENFILDSDTKSYLSEMINARNNIVHSKKLMTSHSDRNKLKTDWGASVLNEYEIFAKKRPWHWMKSLKTLSVEYNK